MKLIGVHVWIMVRGLLPIKWECMFTDHLCRENLIRFKMLYTTGVIQNIVYNRCYSCAFMIVHQTENSLQGAK